MYVKYLTIGGDGAVSILRCVTIYLYVIRRLENNSLPRLKIEPTTVAFTIRHCAAASRLPLSGTVSIIQNRNNFE